MLKRLSTDSRTLLAILPLIILLLWIPTGFPVKSYPDSKRAVAMVLATDDAGMYNTGMIRQGVQVCKLRILNGPFKGEVTEGSNRLLGKLEIDKVFAPGDKVLVGMDLDDGRIVSVNLIDHFRLHLEIILFLIFLAFLLVFAGWTGARALLSYILTVLVIWKVLVPSLLRGWNPLLVSLLAVTVLIVMTILLVGGWNRKAGVAIAGSLSGTAVTCALAIVFGHLFRIHGAVMPFSETLIYSGYEYLNLTSIFIAAIYIASAGAIMDLAMDISAAVYEIVEQNPAITAWDAMQSGFNVGRVVLGTMTTTLLLAYSGGYIALLMVFMAQGTPMINILNLKYVAAEVLHTMVGSIGLVMVAPLTAVFAGLMFTRTMAKHLSLERADVDSLVGFNDAIF